MTTATRRPRPDFAPLLFLPWAVLVLGGYLLHHPLPLHDGVPVKMGMLTAGIMLAIMVPLWRTVNVGRGPQAEHLLLLPVLLVAGLAMLPADLLASVSFAAGIGFCLLWLPMALSLRQTLGSAGFCCAMLVWFPGLLLVSAWPWLWLGVPVLFLLWLGGGCAARKYHWQPHRYLRRALMVVLALGITLTLAAVQRNLHPVGYLTGCVDREQWRQQYGVQP